MRTTAPIALLGLGFIVACPAPADVKTGGNLAPPAQSAAPASQPKSAAASQPAADPTAAGEVGEPIGGVITVASGMSVNPTDVLFIMARESQGGGKAGRLVAVKRFGQVTFPKRYELSSKDAMVPGVPFKGPFVVYARLDKDGDPMTKGDEDLYGAFSGDVGSGQDSVNIELNKKAASPSNKPVSAPAH